MKLFLQGLFAFEVATIFATFIAHLIVIAFKQKVSLKIYVAVFLLTIIMYELFIIGMT